MSRRGKRGGRGSGGGEISAAQIAAALPAGTGIMVPSSLGQEASFVGGSNGYSGVDFGSDRGWIYWPQLDTRREITTYSRREMLKRSRALTANVGLAGHIVCGIAEILGYLTPLAMSEDEEWNDLANFSFRNNQEVPEIFDAAGKFGFSEYQLQLDITALRDADVLPVLTESATGRARIATYEAHQIANPQGEIDSVDGWRDGVKMNKFNRHMAYYLRDPIDPSQGQTVLAQNAIYYGHWETIGHNRPLGILSRALNHLQDIGEIVRDIKAGIKVRNLMPLSLETELGSTNFGDGATQAMINTLLQKNEVVPDGAGGSKQTPVNYEQVMHGQNIPQLRPGQTLKALIDSAPHPNQFNALAWLVRDISWGCGFPPELLWDMTSLRGANNRLLNSKVQRTIGRKLQAKRKFVQRYWVYAISKEVKAGRLRPCRDPQWWTKIAMLPQESMTADRAKEGKLDIDAVSNRLMTLQDWFGKQGKWWLDELKQIARERKECAALGIAVADIARANVIDPAADDEADDPEPDHGTGSNPQDN